MLTEPIELPNMKRHSEGTFSNDYSKYLETRRAQDFVQWLKNSKRNGWVCPLLTLSPQVKPRLRIRLNIVKFSYFSVLYASGTGSEPFLWLSISSSLSQNQVLSNDTIVTLTSPFATHLHIEKLWLNMRLLPQEPIQTPRRRHLHQRRELLPAGWSSQGVRVLAEDRPRQKRLNSSAPRIMQTVHTDSVLFYVSQSVLASFSASCCWILCRPLQRFGGKCCRNAKSHRLFEKMCLNHKALCEFLPSFHVTIPFFPHIFILT